MLAMWESLHLLGSYTALRESIILTPEPLGWGLKLDCGHTALLHTTVNAAACLAGRSGPAGGHGKEQWDVRGRDLPPTPSYWKTRIKYKYFLWGMKANWKLPAFFFFFSWLLIFKSITVEVSPLYALTLIKTWCEILLRKTQINFMFTIALWKERKRKREKQPDFWF